MVDYIELEESIIRKAPHEGAGLVDFMGLSRMQSG